MAWLVAKDPASRILIGSPTIEIWVIRTTPRSVERKIMRNLFLWMIRLAGLAGFIAAAAGGLRVFHYGREFAGQFSLAAGMILMCGAFTLSRLIQPRD